MYPQVGEFRVSWILSTAQLICCFFSETKIRAMQGIGAFQISLITIKNSRFMNWDTFTRKYDCNMYMVQVNQTISRDFHRRALAIELYWLCLWCADDMCSLRRSTWVDHYFVLEWWCSLNRAVVVGQTWQDLGITSISWQIILGRKRWLRGLACIKFMVAALLNKQIWKK